MYQSGFQTELKPPVISRAAQSDTFTPSRGNPDFCPWGVTWRLESQVNTCKSSIFIFSSYVLDVSLTVSQSAITALRRRQRQILSGANLWGEDGGGGGGLVLSSVISHNSGSDDKKNEPCDIAAQRQTWIRFDRDLGYQTHFGSVVAYNPN